MLPIRLPASSTGSPPAPPTPPTPKANGRRSAAVLLAGATLFAGSCSQSLRDLGARDGSIETFVDRTGRCHARRAAPPEAVPHYDMSIEIDPSEGTVTGTSEVTFVASRRTRRLVFRLWPNGPRLAGAGAALVVGEASLRTGDATVDRPDPTTLVFELAEPLPAGAPAIAHLEWRLDLPGAVLDRISQNGSSIRLGSFFPILSWEGAHGWATDPPTTSLAESSTSPTADFDVSVTLPPDLDVIATGSETTAGRWVAQDVRDFAVAVGDFEIVRRSVDAPRPVDVTVGVAAGVEADPEAFADAIERALRDLSRRYGAYPWPAFSMAIMPDLGAAGIEYPSMVFQGDGSLENATTHEVAHSWFYGLAGNNQARDPWLDEGVTSWAQARADGILGYFRATAVPEAVRGRLGKPMSWWDLRRQHYYEGVYVQGVKALDALGDARATDCALKRYVAANAYRVATPADLLDALEAEFPRAERILRRFGARRN